MTTRRARAALGALALSTMLFSACASTGGVPHPFPRPGGWSSPSDLPLPPPEGGQSPLGAAVVATALDLRGVPYRSGGSGPGGFDCSGFTQYVFGQHGLRLPREVRDQFTVGARVDAVELRAGDLLFFATAGREASHVGISMGADRFVHAPSTKGVVRVERLSASYWSRRFLGARRVAD